MPSSLVVADMSENDTLIPLLLGDVIVSEASAVIPWFDGFLEDRPEQSSPPPVPAVADNAAQTRKGSSLRDEGEIGRGGFGAIRRLFDPELRRRIAMKVLSPEIASDETMSKRFVDEARITGLLDHPNIVPVHDLVVDEKGIASYTMKLVEGKTLSELIAAQHTNRDLEHILDCLIKVC